MRWPALPQSVEGLGGPIRVVRVRGWVIADDGDMCNGLYDHDTRSIRISSYIRGRQRWHTFYHELTHAALTDSGAWNELTAKKAETICDAIATSRVRERFG